MTAPKILNMNWTIGQLEQLRDQNQHFESDVICRQIATMLTQTEYAAWWKATPDDNAGFLAAARAKLAELETLKHTPADYTACLTEEGTEPSPIISGGEILYREQPSTDTMDDDNIPF